MKHVIKLAAISTMVAFVGCTDTTKKPKGIDRDNMDLSADPSENFYQYANGGWLKKNPIPGDKARHGSFDVLADESQKKVKDLVENTAKGEQTDPVAKKIGTFYKIGMDTEKINQEGYTPIKPLLEKVYSINNTNDITSIVATFHQHGISALFNLYPEQDKKNSEMVIAHISQGGLGLTDRDYYFAEGERAEKMRAAYLAMVKKAFMLLGNTDSEATEMAASVMITETKLAEVSMTRLERRDPKATYNKMKVDDIINNAPDFKWKEYFTQLGLQDLLVANVEQPEFVKGMNNLISTTGINEWKNYLTWKLINSTSPYLSEDFVNNNFNFYGKTLMGANEIQPRWKRVLRSTNGALSEAIGQLFVAKYFPPEAKERMLELVANLKTAFGARINNLDWMDTATKVKAKEKLDGITVKIGYPDKWRSYTKLEVKDDSYVMNVLRANKFNEEYYLSQIDKPVDRAQWYMPPQMVNAYYNPGMNEIVFPAAILQPPFFNMEADDAVNYGAIGVVIGHEMTHGFDDQGRKYDKEGNLHDWWTPEDSERFEMRTQTLINQFNGFVVIDDMHADGKLSLGENIADLGGLNISLEAFYLTKQYKENMGYDGFTPVQRFFLGYAHIWAQNIRDAEIIRRTKEDVHSLGKFRVNGPLPNMPEFIEAFSIKENSPMHLPIESRAKIW